MGAEPTGSSLSESATQGLEKKNVGFLLPRRRRITTYVVGNYASVSTEGNADIFADTDFSLLFSLFYAFSLLLAARD